MSEEQTPERVALLRSVQPFPYNAVVGHVVDGDTISVSVPAWSGTPFNPVSVRVFGIDTPESRKPPGKCKMETIRGKAAHAFASTLLKPGDAVKILYRGHDKYFRIDADVQFADGRDLASVMLSSGYAAPYSGGTKQSWCHSGNYPAVKQGGV